MPQSGLLVLPGELDAHVKFHSYIPALILKDAGKVYTVVTITEFEQMVADGGWPDEPVYYYEGLQMLWIRATADHNNPELHDMVTRLMNEGERVMRFANLSAGQVLELDVPLEVPGRAGEFTELPAQPTIALYPLEP